VNDFIAALLVLMALAAVGNFAADDAMHIKCVGPETSWIRVCP
jgi:hypothetical protein